MEKKLYQTYQEIERGHWWFIGRRRIISNILNFSAKDIKILDFGCNAGYLVGYLRNRGFNAEGCDKSSEAVDFGRAQGIKNLKLTENDFLPYGDESFDLVLCLDVLEHLSDDSAGLKEIKRVLKPGGRAVIMVPAFKFLWGLQDRVSHHCRRYVKLDLKKLAVANDLSIQRLSYFNSILFLPIAALRLWQKIIPPRRFSDFDLNYGFLNLILKVIFLSEAFLLKFINFPFGVSLLAILKK
ncbi:MAG: class I SAM-dependent methyltransferase [bacterium]|nr:class I SAM-dependent methyltransferase [bacterium]